MKNKYIGSQKGKIPIVVGIFLVLLFSFSVVFGLWSLMRYNELKEEAVQLEIDIRELNNDIQQLRYMVEAPLDDEFKIRIAREKLGMCFPDEIIFYGNYE